MYSFRFRLFRCAGGLKRPTAAAAQKAGARERNFASPPVNYLSLHSISARATFVYSARFNLGCCGAARNRPMQFLLYGARKKIFYIQNGGVAFFWGRFYFVRALSGRNIFEYSMRRISLNS